MERQIVKSRKGRVYSCGLRFSREGGAVAADLRFIRSPFPITRRPQRRLSRISRIFSARVLGVKGFCR